LFWKCNRIVWLWGRLAELKLARPCKQHWWRLERCVVCHRGYQKSGWLPR
jgi:hypothetical protein